jgi:hypothetical protein
MMLSGFAGNAFYIADSSIIAFSGLLVFRLTAMTKNTDIVKCHWPPFGIGSQVHTGSTEILGIPGGIIDFLLTYGTMLLLFHKTHFFFPYQRSRKGLV